MNVVLTCSSIFGGVLLLAYTAYMTLKKGAMLESLSESAYVAQCPLAFTFATVTSSLLITPQMIVKAESALGLLGMLFLAGMLLAAASPHYRDLSKTLHYVGAYVAAGASQLLVMLVCWPIMLVWLLYVVYYVRTHTHNVLYAEACCLLSVMIYCIV